MPSIPFFSDLTDGTAVSLMVGVTLKKTLKDTMSATDDTYGLIHKPPQWCND
jgi:hypothetical protein